MGEEQIKDPPPSAFEKRVHHAVPRQHAVWNMANCLAHVAWEPHDELSFQKPTGGGVLSLFFTQRLIPQILVNLCGHTVTAETSGPLVDTRRPEESPSKPARQ